MILPTRLSLTQNIDRLVEPGAWVEHIPFLMWLMETQRPKTFVELGTHTGNSYCAACQTVTSLGLFTRCWAVDTWRGDEHAGFYDEVIFHELKAYHDPRYGSFSRLLRSTFDEALESFADESIDLLHIDGLHTYEAVKHDFESWFPKLAQGGVVLFHDTDERENGFGVWKLWSELASQFPAFEFRHGHGLGVVMPKGRQKWLAPFFDVARTEQEAEVQFMFAALGRANTLRLNCQRQSNELDSLHHTHSEALSRAAAVEEQLRSQCSEALSRAAAVEEQLRSQYRETLSRAAAVEEQLRLHHHEAQQRAASLTDEIQEGVLTAAQMQKTLASLKSKVLDGISLRNVVRSTAHYVCRLYHANRRSWVGKALVWDDEWDHVESLMKQANEDSERGRNQLACERFQEASKLGLLILKKMRGNVIVRASLRGHVINALQQQIRTQSRHLREAHQRFRNAAKASNRRALLTEDFWIELDHYSRQAGSVFENVDSALRHYDVKGSEKGLDPHPLFSTRTFLEKNHGVIDPEVNPLVEYRRLLSEGMAPEAHECYSGSWLRTYFWGSLSATSFNELPLGIPTPPTEEERAVAFCKLQPICFIGVILFHTPSHELSKMLKILDHAADTVVTMGLERPQFVFTDNSFEWNNDSVLACADGIKSQIHFLPSAKNAGFGRGHNDLMQQAFQVLGATHYLCLNPDGYLHPAALAELLKAAALQGRPALVEALQAPCEHPKDYDAQTLETKWSSAGCLLIPRFLFELTGGFDDRFFMYCEDVDLSWRVWCLGYPCVVAPRAYFHHSMLSRKHQPKVDQWFLESGRMLCAKWGETKLRLLCERYLVERGYYDHERNLPSLAEMSVLTPNVKVDFGNMFTFSTPRW
jgi:GT2 family glycosyltransferase